MFPSASRVLAAGLALTLATGLGLEAIPAHAATPVGAAFSVATADLAYILKQIAKEEAPSPDARGGPDQGGDGLGGAAPPKAAQ